MKTSYALVLFFIVAAIEVTIQFFNLLPYDVFIKPLLVPLLALWYIRQSFAKEKIFLLALLGCWVGDVFLLFAGIRELFFILGLGSFLGAQVLFIITYQKFCWSGEGLNGPQKIRAAFPVLLAATGLVTVLYPSLGALKIPVMVYALVLAWMVVQSFFRYGRTSSASFWSISFGALLFLVSDSLLALNKFHQPVPLAGVGIMTTYLAAVFWIVKGAIRHQSVS
ncbi:MAG: lysoplasmalogenase [Bacteroidetes bacterium]|nr:lysoplasmalogenase [Bacteroidota bacterium]